MNHYRLNSSVLLCVVAAVAVLGSACGRANDPVYLGDLTFDLEQVPDGQGNPGEDNTPGLDVKENDGAEPDLASDSLADVPLTDSGFDSTGADAMADTLAGTDTFDGDTVYGEDTVTPVDEQIVKCPGYDEQTKGCSVVSGNEVILIKSNILTEQRVIFGGQVLVSSAGQIACVGCDCSAEDGFAGATVIDCPSGVLSPGFINAHDHLTFDYNWPGTWGTERYEHRHDWRKGLRGHTKLSVPGFSTTLEMIWTELRQVMAGTTSMAGSGSTKGFLRNVDKSAQEGLNQDPVQYSTFPLGDSAGTLKVGSCDYGGGDDKTALAHDCYLAHVSEGIDKEARNEFLCLSSDENGGVDLTEPNSAFVHMVGLMGTDAAEVARSGTAVVWSPRSNIALYGNTTPVPLYKRAGVLLAIGTDWTASGSINIQRELRCAMDLNENYYNHAFTDKELWTLATGNAARALALDDVVGFIEAGRFADLALFTLKDPTAPYRSVIGANIVDLRLVLRGGAVLYGDSDLVAGLKDVALCEEIPGGVCGQNRTVCMQRETAKTLAEIVAGNVESYPLYFCDVPESEPSCVPFRPKEYDGVAKPGDKDGDGVADQDDNCPYVFNPPRPVDEGKQGDFDEDGKGDMCDPCPFNKGNKCFVPGNDDPDGDGLLNDNDNCPNDSNPLQEDEDQDGTGDACDYCPAIPNPGNGPCPSTIYEIKQGLVQEGVAVEVSGVVTGVWGLSFFMQVPKAELDATLGTKYSGISVFVPAANPAGITKPSIGDKVLVAGTVLNYWDQLELTSVEKVTVTGKESVPMPTLVKSVEVGNGGALSAAYESVLVRVQKAEVTDVNPVPGTGDSTPTNEYVLDDVLRVDDIFYLTAPFPRLGDRYDAAGILRLANSLYKLEPRSEEDVQVLQSLRALQPEKVYVKEGAVNSVTSPELKVYLSLPAPAAGVAVTMSSKDLNVVQVKTPATVTAGQTEAAVLVSAKGAAGASAQVEASYDGRTHQAQVVIYKSGQVPKPLSLSPAPALVYLDSELEFTLLLDVPAPAGGAQVAITSDPPGHLVHEASLTIPENAISGVFTVTGLASGKTTLRVECGGGSVQVEVEVKESATERLMLTEVFYDPPSTDDQLEWVELYNGTGKAIDLSNWSLGYGGTSYLYGRYQLAGSIGPGECVVVGGPTVDPLNYSPTYFQSLDFNPDIQNSGDVADGLALFSSKAVDLKNTTVPRDAVLYGSTNSSNLLDETGVAGAVDVGDASSGQSLERFLGGWRKQSKPNPGDCSAALSN